MPASFGPALAAAPQPLDHEQRHRPIARVSEQAIEDVLAEGSFKASFDFLSQ
jgi:hypothetical protein